MKKIQKTLFMLIYTLFVMTAGFAADFTWKVDATSSLWDDRDNWTYTGTLHSGHPGYPSNDDNATIVSSANSPIITTSITINSLTITSGSLSISGVGNLTLSGNFTNNGGTFIANTGTVNLAPSGDITVTGTDTAGNTKFHTLKLINAGGKTLTVNGKISVTGNMTLRGTNAGNPLTIDGGSSTGTESPEIVLTAANTTRGQYLKVRTNIPITGGTYRTSDSFPYASAGDPAIGNGNPAGWIFDDYNGTLTWKGNYSSNWNDWQNWNIPGTPGVNSVVTIEKKPTSPPLTHYYPILTASVSAKSVTIEQGAELDLGAYIIQDSGAGSAVTTHITNNGTLKMDGTATGNPGSPGQKEWLELINTSPTNNNITHGNNSTIEYYGSTDNHIWQGPYKNLSLNNRDRLTINNQPLTVSSHLKIHNKHAIIDTGSGDQTYSGNISADEIPGTNPKKRYNIKFQTNGTVTTQHAVTAGDIHVTGNWKSDPVDNAPLNIASTGKIEVGGTWTAGSDSFTAQVNISLKGNLSAGAFTHKKGSLTFNGTGSPEQEINFTGTGQKNIRNLIVDNGSSSPASNAKVKLLSSVMIAGDFTNKGAFNANNNDISLDGSFTNSGTFNTGTGNSLVFNSTFTNNGIFNADADTIVFIGNTFTNSGTFTAGTNNTVNLAPSGDITITGTDTAGNTKFHTLKLINAGGKTLTVNGKISVSGNLILEGSDTADNQLLTIEGEGSAATPNSAICINNNKSGGKWLKVKTNIPIGSVNSSTYKYTTTFSRPEGTGQELAQGKPENWVFSSPAALTWTGKNGNDWSISANWAPAVAPTPTTNVIIPQGCTNYPQLTTDVQAKQVKVEANAKLYLNNQRIMTVSGSPPTQEPAKVFNKGSVYLNGTADQKGWLNQPGGSVRPDFNHIAGSTIVYQNVTAANAEIDKGPYQNLTFESGVPDTIKAAFLKVNETLTIEKSITIDTSTSNGDQTYRGEIKAGTNNITFLTSTSATITTSSHIKAGNITVTAATWNSSGNNTSTGSITATGNWSSTSGFAKAANEITVSGGNWSFRGDITATSGKIEVRGDWTWNPDINTRTVTAGKNIEANKWTSTGGTITAGTDIKVTGVWNSGNSDITGRNITSGGSKWTSWGGITATGNIDIANELAFTGRIITVEGNLTAKKLNASSTAADRGLIIFNGSGTQKLSGKNSNNIEGGSIQNLQINSSSSLQLESDITITVGLNNQGVLDAAAKSKTVTLNHKANEVKISGTSDAPNTKFHKLECTGAGGKTLTIENKISVANYLTLSGAIGNLLTIDGYNNAQIHLTNNHGLTGGNAKGNYLKIYTEKVKIQPNGKYYVVKDSKDNFGAEKSKNGWVFFKTGLNIVNSFAKPGEPYIYLLFNNTELSLEEFKALDAGSLTITNGPPSPPPPPYTSDLHNASSEGSGVWKIPLNNAISAEHILTPSYQINLNYFGTNIPHKQYISDIGINIVDPLKAFNSIVLYDFGAATNDPGLTTLDVTIPTIKKAASDNVKLYFISKNNTGGFWYPNTITPPPAAQNYASSQSGSNEYSPIPGGSGNQINFIIPSTDNYLVKDKIGQFMYVYDGWLPCARLKDSNNILSFDVWNFNIAGVQKQKGGVSIFDNVVNPHKGQSAKIAAHLKKSGMLTIQIMTLDGNVVRTLARSHKNAGDHVYTWDGRNNGGNPVASGMYFVRIAGPEIDEVRKILVIK